MNRVEPPATTRDIDVVVERRSGSADEVRIGEDRIRRGQYRRPFILQPINSTSASVRPLSTNVAEFVLYDRYIGQEIL